MSKIFNALAWLFAALSLVYLTAGVSFFAENEYKEAGKGLLLAVASFAVCYGCDWLCGFSQAKKGQGRL